MTSIKVRVMAYGKIRRNLSGKFDYIVKIEVGSRVRDLFQVLGKPEGDIWMVNVNGLLVDEDWKLNDGDEVKIFEPVGGG